MIFERDRVSCDDFNDCHGEIVMQASFLSIVGQVVCKGSVDAKLGHTHDKELDRSM
jgi:hypothetical protein